MNIYSGDKYGGSRYKKMMVCPDITENPSKIKLKPVQFYIALKVS